MVIKALLGGRDFIALLGYVYYEFDCWMRLKNPYLPLDVHNPTMMQDTQRNLSGEGKAERQQAVKGGPVHKFGKCIVCRFDVCENFGVGEHPRLRRISDAGW